MSVEQASADFMRKYGSTSVKKKHHKKRKSYSTGSQGWVEEPARHSMSAYGIKSGRKARDFQPKQNFKSAPYIKAGIGGALAVAGFIARAKAKADEKRKIKEAEEKAEKERKERIGIYEGQKDLPTRFVESNPAIRYLEERQKRNDYLLAKRNAEKTRLEQAQKVYEIQHKGDQQ